MPWLPCWPSPVTACSRQDLPWDVSHDGVITHSGFPLPRLGAVFTTLALDDRGTGTLTTDPLGVGVLYRADGPDRTAIASHASLAGISAGHPSPLRRSVEALGWLLSFDNIVGNGTGFEGILALPARRSSVSPTIGGSRWSGVVCRAIRTTRTRT